MKEIVNCTTLADGVEPGLYIYIHTIPIGAAAAGLDLNNCEHHFCIHDSNKTSTVYYYH
jgi:hypothetical protein